MPQHDGAAWSGFSDIVDNNTDRCFNICILLMSTVLLLITARVLKTVHITQQKWGNVNYRNMAFSDVIWLLYM